MYYGQESQPNPPSMAGAGRPRSRAPLRLRPRPPLADGLLAARHSPLATRRPPLAFALLSMPARPPRGPFFSPRTRGGRRSSALVRRPHPASQAACRRDGYAAFERPRALTAAASRAIRHSPSLAAHLGYAPSAHRERPRSARSRPRCQVRARARIPRPASRGGGSARHSA